MSKIKLRSVMLVLCSVVLLTTSALTSVFATDRDFYSANDILFYNPDSCPAGSSTSMVSFNPATSLNGTTNREKVFNFWVSQGLSSDQAAGISGSLQAEGGFSPFRQEESQTWPAGGYGIAQFTGGQRSLVTTDDPNYNLKSLGDVYTQYYVPDYGGGVGDSGVPSGVPSSINDQFLLVELNYLASFTSSYIPNSTRTSGLATDYSISYPNDGTKLLPFLGTLSSSGDVAKAWTYLYEYPANIKDTAKVRADFADNILQEFNNGASQCNDSQINCPGSGSGSLTAGDGSATAIVSTARCLAFSEKGKGAGLCGNKNGSGPNTCKGPIQPDSYKAALEVFGSGISNPIPNAAGCASFTSVVMRMSGGDPDFGKGYNTMWVPDLIVYMTKSDKWDKVGVTDGGSSGGIKPGDVVTGGGSGGSGYNGEGHIYVYLGDGMVAQASGGFQWPQIQNAWMKGTVWRLKANE